MKALGVFFAVLAAIAVAVFLFAPERLPRGIGLTRVPLEVGARPSLVGEGHVAIVRNPTSNVLHNVQMTCTNPRMGLSKILLEDKLVPGQLVEIGWLEGWRWQEGDALTLSAAGYAAKTWRWEGEGFHGP